MDQHKIEHFERDFPEASFPMYVALDAERCVRLAGEIAERLGVIDVDTLSLVRALHDAVPYATGGVPETTEFDFPDALKGLGFEVAETVFVNWDRFETVESMPTAQLARYFDYIWYPSVDDIEIFDENLNWVLRVDHSGVWGLVDLRLNA